MGLISQARTNLAPPGAISPFALRSAYDVKSRQQCQYSVIEAGAGTTSRLPRGVHSASIAALTAQNACGVSGIGAVPAKSDLANDEKRRPCSCLLSGYRPLLWTSNAGGIRVAHNEGYASKHRRAGCPNRLGIAIRTRPGNRNICCRDFPLPWSRNRCSGLGWSLRAWPLRALLPGQERRQRR